MTTPLTQPKVDLITGVTGQDGSYLAEFLLEKGYTVHGIKRRASSFNTQRVDHIYQDPHEDNARLKLHYGDLIDSSNLTRIIQETQPDEIYNLGAQSHVAVSFESPEYTADVDGMYACNGILFNYESPRRGETFVTRKITRGLANISLGLEDCLYIGNIDALRDWGHAKDYVRMQWMLLLQTEAEDLVIATGVQYSVRQFIEWTGAELGMQIRWEGTGVNEVGYWLNPPLPTGEGMGEGARPIIKIEPRYFRPTEVETLLGDPTKAKQKLGWVPEITLDEMVQEMVAADLADAKKHALLKQHGYQIAVSVE
jgi:GDP-D-mannose dehydratase